MATLFRLPDLGEGLHEAEIVAWHVGVDDHVVKDQPLCSVETDKAVVEIPAPQAGRIMGLHGAPGDVIEVGAPLVEFSSADVDADAVDSGSVLELSANSHAAPRQRQGRKQLAPAVRRLAASLGVDVESIEGTGPQGAITKSDVESAAASTGTEMRVRSVRRAMLQNMARAGREIVPATVTDEADIQSWPESSDITVRLIRAVVAGCQASPPLNAWFDSKAETLKIHSSVDLGLAVETEDGLFAPVIRNAANSDVAELRKSLETIKADTANRSVPRSALQGATITLSNFGMFGGRFASLVVIPPQVAILGAGRADVRVVPVEGSPQLHRMLPLSLSFDHRVVTGVEATRFLNAVIVDLEKPN